MKASTGAGKGDTYRPVNKVRFDAGYERACGKDCGTCRRKGYLWQKNKHGKMVKVTCVVCNGKGIQMGE